MPAGMRGRRTISRAVESLVLTAAALPPPTTDEAARSSRVAAAIARRIAAADGWLPFSAFMEAALYEPGLGYYMSDGPIFGAQGDFVTAPELSPLFAACIANGIADLLEKAGGGDVVEFGAGSGRLAQRVFASLVERGAPVGRYRIVEPSPALAARQRELVAREPGTAEHVGRFDWRQLPPSEAWQGVALANEVVDALPVDRFRVTATGVDAIGVVATPAGFAWEARPADVPLADAVEAIQGRLPARMPAGYHSEIRRGQRGWLQGAATTLARGAVLLVDYGLPRAQYYHPSRDGGTLCAFRRHRRVEEVLSNAGIQDLTAWVDFSALAEDGASCGLEPGGFATQAHYLIETGIERELARLTEGVGERECAAHRHFAATMMLPGEMGERFKAMALVRGIRAPFLGFGFRDLSASL
jgi:SAM-dependent MidA family methyltransferase